MPTVDNRDIKQMAVLTKSMNEQKEDGTKATVTGFLMECLESVPVGKSHMQLKPQHSSFKLHCTLCPAKGTSIYS